MDKRELFKTTDRFVAGVLKSFGLQPCGAECIDGRISILFDDSDNRASEIARDHLSGRVEIRSSDYVEAVRGMTDYIFSERRARGL